MTFENVDCFFSTIHTKLICQIIRMVYLCHMYNVHQVFVPKSKQGFVKNVGKNI